MMQRLGFALVAIALAACLGHVVWQAIGLWADAFWYNHSTMTETQMLLYSYAVTARDHLSAGIAGATAFLLMGAVSIRREPGAKEMLMKLELSPALAEKALYAAVSIMLGAVVFELTRNWFSQDSFLGQYVVFFLPLSTIVFSYRLLRRMDPIK